MILVTGGTGLIGSHLLYRLLANGYKVKALCRKGSSKKDVKDLFDFYEASPLFFKIEWVEGDVQDYYSILNALHHVTHVYHCAAMVSFRPSDRKMMYSVNVEGTANVVDACIEKKITKLCHVSSIATLGKSHNGSLIDEECYWQSDDNHSFYSQTKYKAEMEVWRGIKEGLKAVIVNPSVVIGPGNPNKSSGELLQKVSKGMRFYTSGSTGFVPVKDVVCSMICLMNSAVENERFILNGENVTYQHFLTLASKAFKVAPPSLLAPRWLLNVVWRIEYLKYIIFRSLPRLTKEAARTSMNHSKYSSLKVKKVLLKDFTSLHESLLESVIFLTSKH